MGFDRQQPAAIFKLGTLLIGSVCGHGTHHRFWGAVGGPVENRASLACTAPELPVSDGSTTISRSACDDCNLYILKTSAAQRAGQAMMDCWAMPVGTQASWKRNRAERLA